MSEIAETRPPSRRPPRIVIAAGLALVVAIGGAVLINMPKGSEATEDAYIQSDATTIAPKVRGLVEQVLVADNQSVKAGQPLIAIDPEEFQARVAAAAAQLADANARVASSAAALASLDAEERLAAANVRATDAAIRATDAEKLKAQADRRRYDALAASGAVSQRDVDAIRTAAVSAEQGAVRAGANLDVAREGVAVTRAKRPGAAAELARAQAAVASAQAALDLAQQDLRHAVITAPVDGVVANRQAQPGDYVQPGTRLMTLVPAGGLYVTANFKETQTSRMLPGQKAAIRVDALPGAKLTGTVESLAPGSGSRFALLPFEPGTGNFTKIVQRIPVRIRFDPRQSQLARLRSGLSVTAEVRLRD